MNDDTFAALVYFLILALVVVTLVLAMGLS
jgi:predicted nucleic acid-binding Zn ribbon protein